MKTIKTTNKDLELIIEELTDIFIDYRGLNGKIINRLLQIGFYVIKGNNHSKIVMPVGTMVISNTPSDKNAGRQILRQIRRMYERI